VPELAWGSALVLAGAGSRPRSRKAGVAAAAPRPLRRR
jgi:hypothetical protein